VADRDAETANERGGEPRAGAPRVQFLHGLESGPGGDKVQLLRAAGIDVVAPDMEMSIRRLDRRNSVVRNLLRLPDVRAALAVAAATAALALRRGRWGSTIAVATAGATWLAARRGSLRRRALRLSYEACIAIQREAIERHAPDVLLGSSWGGAVAIELVARGHWRGPTVLLAPAFHRVARGLGWHAIEPELAHLRALAASRPVIVFHDPDDDTVPFADSVALTRGSAIRLERVSAGGHRLMGLLEDGSLAATLRRLADG
jgi:hypothetical protein